MNDELSIDDLRAVLAEHGTDLTQEQALALRDFIDEIGDLDEAILALEQLDKAA